MVLNNLPLSNKYLIAVGVIAAIDDVDVIVFNTVRNNAVIFATLSVNDKVFAIVLVLPNVLVGVSVMAIVGGVTSNFESSNIVGSNIIL